MVEEVEYTDTVFIGAVDFNMLEDEFVEEVKSWGNITKVYYRGPTSGWGTATFASSDERNKFLAKKRFVLGSKIVDVKPFKRPKYKQPGVPGTNGTTSTPAATPTVSTPKPPTTSMPSVVPGMPTPTRPTLPGATASKPGPISLSSASSVPTALTGVILRYTSPNYGVIRTNNHGNGILSADVVYLCSNPDHNLMCKTADCPTYTKLTAPKRAKKSLFAALPVGTQISFYCRTLEIGEFNFQATMAWPQLSKKPAGATPSAVPSNSYLDEQLRQFLSSEDSRADDSEKEKSKVASVAASKKIDDESLDDLDLLDELDLEIALDHLNGITSFLQILGVQTEGLTLTPLIDKLLAIKHEAEAVDEIIEFFNQNGVRIDESRKRNLMANYRTLLHSLRISPDSNSGSGTPTPDPLRDEATLAERFCQFLIRETTPEYFKWVNNKETIEKHCRGVVTQWELRGYSITKLATEYKDSRRDGTLQFLHNRWRREIEMPVTDIPVPCLIEPIKIFELTILFFEREYSNPTVNGGSTITRSSSGTSISNTKNTSAPSTVSSSVKKSSPPPSTVNESKKISSNILSELHKLTVPADPLKQLNSHFKMPSLLEGKIADEMSSLLENDTDFRTFSPLTAWLKANYSSCLNTTIGVDTSIMFVYSIVRAWSASRKSIAEIKDIFTKYISEPKHLFAYWAYFLKSNDFLLSTDTVLKTTFKFCFDNIPACKKNVDSTNILAVYQNVPFIETEIEDNASGRGAVASSYFNIRGIIIHLFNEDYGVIQTPVGRVLFERNVAFSYKDSAWKRCKSKDMMPQAFSLVKLHVRVSKLKWVRRNQTDLSLLYATKIWTWTDASVEPYTGTSLMGRDMYWTIALKEFESLVKVNPILLYSLADKAKAEEDYRNVFEYVLKNKKENSVAGMDSQLAGLDSESENMGYDPFISYLASSSQDYKDNKKPYLASIKALSSSPHFANFHSLRKKFLLHNLTDTMESFEELLETTIYYSPQSSLPCCDVVPKLVDFFKSKDPITDAQLQEQRKSLSKNAAGTNAHIEDTLSWMTNLIEIKPVPPASSMNGNIANNHMPSTETGARAKVAPEPSLAPGQMVVNLTEWNAIVKRISELEKWKEFKQREEADYRSKMDATIGQLADRIVSLTVQAPKTVEYGAEASRVTKSPPAPPTKNGSSKSLFVKITVAGSNEIHEFPTDDNGNLQVESVMAVFQGTTALKYQTDSGTTRICRKHDDIFEQPEEGWDEKIYQANISTAPNDQFRGHQRPSMGSFPPSHQGAYPLHFGLGGGMVRPNMVPGSLGYPFAGYPTNIGSRPMM